MHVITIDLAKNPDLAALIADKEPGAKIDLHTAIKDKNDQTASFTLEECSEGAAAEKEEGAEGGDEDTPKKESPPAEPAKPEKSYGRKYLDVAGGE